MANIYVGEKPSFPGLRDMRSSCLHEQGIQRLAACHKQAVPLGATKTDIRADFRQADLADAVPVWSEDVDSIVAIANPSGARPDIAVFITTDPIGESGLAIQIHICKGSWILQTSAVN